MSSGSPADSAPTAPTSAPTRLYRAKIAVRRRSLSGRRAVLEVVERGDTVGLRPHADAPSSGDPIVLDVDIGLAAERDANSPSCEVDAQRVPAIFLHRGIDVFDRIASAVLRVIERNVVLERIGARDVIVVAALEAPHDAAGLIFVAGQRLEF